MPTNNDRGRWRLADAHPDLRRVFERALEQLPLSVIWTFRPIEKQAEFVSAGTSRTMKSKHVLYPAEAVDFAPLTWDGRVSWDSVHIPTFCYLAGGIMAIGRELGVPLRYGGDWNRNGLLTDPTDLKSLRDFGHVEWVKP